MENILKMVDVCVNLSKCVFMIEKKKCLDQSIILVGCYLFLIHSTTCFSINFSNSLFQMIMTTNKHLFLYVLSCFFGVKKRK